MNMRECIVRISSIIDIPESIFVRFGVRIENLGTKSRLIEIPKRQELGVNKHTEKPIEKQFNTSQNDNVVSTH